MQTIDLGTISIGGEDLGAAKPAAPECPVCDAPLSVSEEIVQESILSEDVRPARAAEGFSGTGARPCPDGGEELCFERCEDYKMCRIGDAAIDGQGRILDLSMRLKDVCPGKRVAVGVMLHEVDARGARHPRGMKTFTVPAHRHGCCADVPVETVRFILPEDAGCGAGGPCGDSRHFIVKVSAHYIDFNSGGAAL